MDDDLVEQWRAAVPDDTVVWVLGDVAMRAEMSGLDRFAELTGYLVLHPGNHDRPWRGRNARRSARRRRTRSCGLLVIARTLSGGEGGPCERRAGSRTGSTAAPRAWGPGWHPAETHPGVGAAVVATVLVAAAGGVAAFMLAGSAEAGGGASPVAAGVRHSCAVTEEGTAKCWGINHEGALGDGTTTDSHLPVEVKELTGVSSVAIGELHSCALLEEGTVHCWGANGMDQLGAHTDATLAGSTVEVSLTPVQVEGLAEVTAIAAGMFRSCALLEEGTVRCWGSGALGVRQNDGHSAQSLTPVPVQGLTGVIAIAAGNAHTCATLDDGTAHCWGWNGKGQLGDGTTTDSATPVQVQGLSDVAAIAVGSGHSCALLADGTVRCWGGNELGELGDGTTADSPTPVLVQGLSNVTDIAAGLATSCALLDDRTVHCWGYRADWTEGDPEEAPTPVLVDGLDEVVAIDIGRGYMCGMAADHAAYCWGSNSAGTLGDGTTNTSPTPVRVDGLN